MGPDGEAGENRALEGVAEKCCLCHVGAHVCPTRDVGASIQGKWSASSLLARHPG